MSSWDPTDAAVLSDAPSLHLTVGSEVVELGMVVVDGSLYVRAFRGPASRWYRAALTDPAGRIRVGPLDRAVSLAPHPEPPGAVDAAYHAKYGSLGTLVDNPQARRATLRVSPT
jgi:hypothetical protein